jgi:hypothetical protein
MAELRERLKKMKAESKRSAEKLAKQRLAKTKKTIKKDKPLAAKAVAPVKPIAEPVVEPILTPPANNAPKPAIETQDAVSTTAFDEGEPEATTGEIDTPVVGSVENLPVIDAEATPDPAPEKTSE